MSFWRCCLWDKFRTLAGIVKRSSARKPLRRTDGLASKYMKTFGWNPINRLRPKLVYQLPGWLFKLLPLKKKFGPDVPCVLISPAKQCRRRNKAAARKYHLPCHHGLECLLRQRYRRSAHDDARSRIRHRSIRIDFDRGLVMRTPGGSKPSPGRDGPDDVHPGGARLG